MVFMHEFTRVISCILVRSHAKTRQHIRSFDTLNPFEFYCIVYEKALKCPIARWGGKKKKAVF